MSTPGITLDLNLDDAAFLAVFDDLLQVKVDEMSGIEDVDARRKAIAAWGNLMDDFLIAAKRAERHRYRGNGAPEGVVTAPVGSFYQRLDAAGATTALYVKGTGTGNTGWSALGSGVTDHGALTGLADDDHPQYVLTSALSELVDDRVAALLVDSASVDWTYNDAGGSLNAVVIQAGLDHGSIGGLADDDHPQYMLAAGGRTVYEVNFASLATNDFANGAEVVDGRSWTAAQRAAAALMQITNGTGLQWAPAVTTAGAFSSSTQTSAHAYIDVATLIGSSFDPAARYSFELYVPTRTFQSTGATRLYFGLWLPSATPLGASARARLGALVYDGTSDWNPGVQIDASAVGATATNLITTHNVFGVTVDPNCTQFYSGIWASGWPTLAAQRLATTVLGTTDPLNRGDARFVIAFNHNSLNPATAAFTIERLRVRRL